MPLSVGGKSVSTKVNVNRPGKSVDSGATFDTECHAPIQFASDPSEVPGKIESGIKSRRPGGSMRSGTWHTSVKSKSEPTKS